VQAAVDCGTLAGIKIVLEFDKPALNRFDRSTNRRGGDNAFDSDFRGRLLVREQNFVQPFARPNAGEGDFDVQAGLETAQANHPFRQIDNLDRLTHVQHVN